MENLTKDTILPLLSAVSCGGFFLFGSPIIYMQELEQTREFYRETMNVSKMAHNNSIIQMP